jgi:DNA-binding transcriptional ArsR family regulator
MPVARILAVSPRLELFFALAAVLSGGAAGAQPDGVRRWLDQARRRLDQNFRRRLGDQAQSPDFWRQLAAQPLPRDAALVPDADGVIEALGADPEHFRSAEALRRFDRLAFAAFWRPWREELLADAQRLEARLRTLPTGALPPWAESVLFIPSRFAPPGFVASVEDGHTVLLPFDPDRLPRAAPAPVLSPRAAGAAPCDPALTFRALGDATRYAVAGLIARAPMTGAALARRLGTSPATMSHHLKLMREAALVIEERRGKQISFSLDRTAIEALSAAAAAELFGAAVLPLRRSRRSRN